MSAAAIVGLSICAAATLGTLAAILMFGLRASALAKRASALGSHPTLVALQRAQKVSEQLQNVTQKLSDSRERFGRIGASLADIAASAALLELNVDRVAFATNLFLQTFVPTLVGSMADE